MHICYVYPGFPPENHAGGIGTFIGETVKLFIGTEHKIHVISRSEKVGDAIELIFPNITIHRLGEGLQCTHDSNVLFRKDGFKNYYKRVMETVEILDNIQKLDIIEGCDWGAECSDLLAKFLDRLLIRCHTPAFIAQNFNPHNAPYLSSEILSAEKILLQQATYLACPSKSLIDLIKQSTTLSADAWIEPYPLDTTGLVTKTNYETKNNSLEILSVGRIEERKGQDILFEACQILAKKGYKIRLSLIGIDTPSLSGEPTSTQFLRLLGEPPAFELCLLGPLPRIEVLRLYHSYDIFIIASRFDNFPFTLLEAMSAGIPVIANNSSGMAEILQSHPHGLLFEGTPKSLSEQMEILSQDVLLRERLGKSAAAHAQEAYSRDTIYRMMIEHYSLICR